MVDCGMRTTPPGAVALSTDWIPALVRFGKLVPQVGPTGSTGGSIWREFQPYAAGSGTRPKFTFGSVLQMSAARVAKAEPL